MIEFRPRFFTSLGDYNIKMFGGDAMAGVIVALVAALPLAIAFAIASGVSPELGLISAIVGGGMIALLSGCKVQIGGPTGSFIVVSYAVIQSYGVQGLSITVFMAGLMLLAMGLFRLGNLIKYIPYPVVLGFTAGMAVIILSTQINEFFGLGLSTIPSDFIDKWLLYIKGIYNIDWPTCLIGLITVLMICFIPKAFKAIPASLIALIVSTLIAYILRQYAGVDTIATIGDRFSIEAIIPSLELPNFDFLLMAKLIEPAFSIALLAAIESLLTARIVDGLIGDKHSPNTELIALGVANVSMSLLAGLPVTGATARTMTNVNNGGRSPVSGLVHALTLLLCFLFLMPWVSYIPMASLAAVLVVVAFNMSGYHTVCRVMRGPKSGSLILWLTFFFTLFASLTFAIQTGVLLSMLFIIKRMIESTSISVSRGILGVNSLRDDVVHTDTEHLDLLDGIEVYEIEGPFFFGTAAIFEERVGGLMNRGEIETKARVYILRMRFVPFMDSTALYNLGELHKSLKSRATQLILSGVNESVRETLRTSGLELEIGSKYICKDIHQALQRAERLLDTTNNEDC